MKNIIIMGAGGNSKVIADIIKERVSKLKEDLKIIGILDDDLKKKSLGDYPVIGIIKSAEEFSVDKETYFINGIGDNETRKKIYEAYSNLQYYTAIHPSAIIGNGVTIGTGSVIMPGVIINADTRVGIQALINTGTIVEHDNIIGDFTHLASGVTTAGNVQVGALAMLGTGAKVIQNIKIGSHTMIGAGAVVVRDIPDCCTAIGVPAKVRRENNDEGDTFKRS